MRTPDAGRLDVWIAGRAVAQTRGLLGLWKLGHVNARMRGRVDARTPIRLDALSTRSAGPPPHLSRHIHLGWTHHSGRTQLLARPTAVRPWTHHPGRTLTTPAASSALTSQARLSPRADAAPRARLHRLHVQDHQARRGARRGAVRDVELVGRVRRIDHQIRRRSRGRRWSTTSCPRRRSGAWRRRSRRGWRAMSVSGDDRVLSAGAPTCVSVVPVPGPPLPRDTPG